LLLCELLSKRDRVWLQDHSRWWCSRGWKSGRMSSHWGSGSLVKCGERMRLSQLQNRSMICREKYRWIGRGDQFFDEIRAAHWRDRWEKALSDHQVHGLMDLLLGRNSEWCDHISNLTQTVSSSIISFESPQSRISNFYYWWSLINDTSGWDRHLLMIKFSSLQQQTDPPTPSLILLSSQNKHHSPALSEISLSNQSIIFLRQEL
jgi:hypothetical protein